MTWKDWRWLWVWYAYKFLVIWPLFLVLALPFGLALVVGWGMEWLGNKNGNLHTALHNLDKARYRSNRQGADT